MPEFEVRDINDELIDTVSMPEKIPARIGNRIEKKLDITIGVKNGEAEFESNVSDFLEIKRSLTDKMIDKYAEEIDVDEISKESYDEIGEHYWKQMQDFMGKKKGLINSKEE